MSKATLVVVIALLAALGCLNVATGELNEICKLPIYAGMGMARLPGWVYNAESKQCEEFTFGGGDINANHFWAKEECEKACGA